MTIKVQSTKTLAFNIIYPSNVIEVHCFCIETQPKSNSSPMDEVKRKSYLFSTKHKFKAVAIKHSQNSKHRNFRSSLKGNISVPNYEFQFFFTVAELMMSMNSA